MLQVVVFAALMLAAGCASDPSAISAAMIPPSVFAGRDCASISTDIAAIEPHLKELAGAQRKRRTTDYAMGILVGITPTMLNNKSDREAEIGRLKGELAGLRRAGAEANCTLPREDPELTEALARPKRPDFQRER